MLVITCIHTQAYVGGSKRSKGYSNPLKFGYMYALEMYRCTHFGITKTYEAPGRSRHYNTAPNSECIASPPLISRVLLL